MPHISLMKLLAIPLGCQTTTTKWLVTYPNPPRYALPQRKREKEQT
jgi:hypothetical protein